MVLVFLIASATTITATESIIIVTPLTKETVIILEAKNSKHNNTTVALMNVRQ